MGHVKLYISEYEFDHFLRYQAFEGKTSREYGSDIEITVPRTAIKEYKKIYNGYLTVYVYEQSKW